LPTAGGDLAQSPSTIAHLAITPNVVDLYHADRVTSFTEAAGGGVLGVIHKATTGETGRDDAYKDRRSAARQAGLLWGAYHWGTTRPAAAQLDNFLTWAQPDETTLVALDFERSNENQMSLDLAREFLSLAEEKLGRKAVLYSGDLVKAQLGGAADPFFRSHRLWLAQYGPRPEVQASWSSFWLWQYTDGVAGPPPHQAPGFGGPGGGGLDCNYYPGDAERLAAEWAS
jgi:GH25 family lysozyme M1 (1,4-beta-N-acetylmuramidase)